MCNLTVSKVIVILLIATISPGCFFVEGHRYAGYYGFHEFPIEPDLPGLNSGIKSLATATSSSNSDLPSSSSPPGPIDVVNMSLSSGSHQMEVKKLTDALIDKVSIPTYLDNHKNVPNLQSAAKAAAGGGGGHGGEGEEEKSFAPPVNFHRITDGEEAKIDGSGGKGGAGKEILRMPSMEPIAPFSSFKVPTDDREKDHEEDLSSYHSSGEPYMKAIKTNHSAHLPRRPQQQQQQPQQQQQQQQTSPGEEGYNESPQQQQQQEPQITHPTSTQEQYNSRHRRPSPYGSRHKKMRIFDYDYDIAYRSDFYWLIPLVIIIGIGALLLPLCSLFMTAMVSNGAINFTGKRRKRSSSSSLNPIISGQLFDVLLKVDSAIDVLRKTFDPRKD